MSALSEMTREELETLINRMIDRRLQVLFGDFDFDVEPDPDDQADDRTLEELFASIDADMWTPPPGAMTSLEILRRDRDGGWGE
jgi:hypothetical protein